MEGLPSVLVQQTAECVATLLRLLAGPPPCPIGMRADDAAPTPPSCNVALESVAVLAATELLQKQQEEQEDVAKDSKHATRTHVPS